MFLLLWIAADREEASAEVNKGNCEYLLAVMEDEIPADTADWSEFASETLAVEVVGKVLRWSDRIQGFLRMGNQEVAARVMDVVLKEHGLVDEGNEGFSFLSQEDIGVLIDSIAGGGETEDTDEVILKKILGLVQESMEKYVESEAINATLSSRS
ncbi:MAG: hypothetical protein IPL26_26360 [Leptospiraceae bacterium]|nr:hypothetical protein [Leptospiraceae bacterium]